MRKFLETIYEKVRADHTYQSMEDLYHMSKEAMKTDTALRVVRKIGKEKYFLIGRWRRIYVDPSCVTYPRKKLRCMDYSTT